MINLYKDLQEKLLEHNPTEVDELILDDLFEDVNNFSEANKADLEKYSNLVHLSLNGFGLKSLKNFPKIKTLQVLEIRSNGINGSDFAAIKELYPELYKLKVGENPITSLDVFKVLADSTIKKIELLDTEAAETKDYRNILFQMLPEVDVIDSINRTGDDVTSTLYEDEEGEMDEDDFGADEDGEDEEEFEEYEDEEGEDDEGEEDK